MRPQNSNHPSTLNQSNHAQFRPINIQNASGYVNRLRTYQKSGRSIRRLRPNVRKSATNRPHVHVIITYTNFRRIHLQNACGHGRPLRTYHKSGRHIRRSRTKIRNSAIGCPHVDIIVTAPKPAAYLYRTPPGMENRWHVHVRTRSPTDPSVG